MKQTTPNGYSPEEKTTKKPTEITETEVETVVDSAGIDGPTITEEPTLTKGNPGPTGPETESGTDESLDFKGRVKVERAKLSSNIQALEAFLETDKYSELDDDDQAHLVAQLEAMGLYRRALDTRIAKF